MKYILLILAILFIGYKVKAEKIDYRYQQPPSYILTKDLRLSDKYLCKVNINNIETDTNTTYQFASNGDSTFRNYVIINIPYLDFKGLLAQYYNPSFVFTGFYKLVSAESKYYYLFDSNKNTFFVKEVNSGNTVHIIKLKNCKNEKDFE